VRPVDPAFEAPRTGAKVVAVAGIARPERFFEALRSEGWDVVRAIAFRDHRWFTDGDLREMARAAADGGADAIVTTEKDAMRLDAARLGALTRVPLACLPLTIAVEPSAPFGDWIAGRLRAARAGRGLAA
jgi:tetraacyldisaccharide 4'-kinase